MTSDDKDFVDREIRHAHELTTERLGSAAKITAEAFNSRDEAIKLLREGKKDNTSTWLALAALVSAAIIGGLGILLAAVGLILQLRTAH